MIRPRTCEHCEFWEHEDVSDGYICTNADSEYLADWTEPDDTCPEYEERDDI